MPGPLCWQEAGGRAPRRAGGGESPPLEKMAHRPGCPPSPRRSQAAPERRRAPGRPHGRRTARGRQQGSLPELTEIRAWRITTCGAMGVAGCNLWSPLATCRRLPETSSPYRKRSHKNTMAAAVVQSRERMEAFKDACRNIQTE